jgi:hypothetical protein
MHFACGSHKLQATSILFFITALRYRIKIKNSVRWLWIARRKTLKTFVPITSKNSASGLFAVQCTSQLSLVYGHDDESPTDESPNKKSRMFRPLDNASLYLYQVGVRPMHFACGSHKLQATSIMFFITALRYRIKMKNSVRWLWLARRKTLKTFVPITSKNSASGLFSVQCTSQLSLVYGHDDESPTDESPNEKSRMFRPLDNASLYLYQVGVHVTWYMSTGYMGTWYMTHL